MQSFRKYRSRVFSSSKFKLTPSPKLQWHNYQLYKMSMIYVIALLLLKKKKSQQHSKVHIPFIWTTNAHKQNITKCSQKQSFQVKRYSKTFAPKLSKRKIICTPCKKSTTVSQVLNKLQQSNC